MRRNSTETRYKFLDTSRDGFFIERGTDSFSPLNLPSYEQHFTNSAHQSPDNILTAYINKDKDTLCVVEVYQPWPLGHVWAGNTLVYPDYLTKTVFVPKIFQGEGAPDTDSPTFLRGG